MAVIVGAGPSGLLLAHLLLSNAAESDLVRGLLPIKVYEAREDPRTPLPLYKSRQYVVGLSARGRDAVSKIDGLWDSVKQEGVLSSQFVLHIGSRKIALKRNPNKPSLLVNQRALTATLLRELEQRYSSDQFEVKYGVRCVSADFDTHTVKFRDKSKHEEVVPYALLVGADGARSAVREAFLRERGFDFQQTNVPYTFKVLQLPELPELSDDAVHTFRVTKEDEVDGKKKSNSMGFGCFPTPNGTSVLISWSPETIPKELLDIWSASELSAYIEKYMPPLKVPLEAAEAFISQRPTTSMQVHCSRFYDARGSAVLVGDAAHAMSNALGQGCNSSLKDVEALSQMLVQEKTIASAIERYSNQQVPEDHSAAYTSEYAFPQAGWLRPAYLLSNILSSAVGNTPLSFLVPPSIQSLCSETLTPYSEIARRHRFWLKLVEVTNALSSKK